MISWWLSGTKGLPTNQPLKLVPPPTPTPRAEPVPLPGENCPDLELSRDEPGVYVFDVQTCALGRFNAAGSDANVAWSPDGSKLAFVRFTAPRSEAGSNIFLLDLHNGRETQVSFAPDERKHSLTWSPDGSKLAFYMRSYSGEGPSQIFGLWVLELATSRQTLLLPDFGHGYCPYAWSPDSRSIAAGCAHGPLYLIDVASAERRVVDDRNGFGNPAWSPNGDMIAYSCEKDSRGPYFACAIRADGSARVMFPDEGVGAVWSFDGSQVVFQGAKLFFGDPTTGECLQVIEEWQGGTPIAFLSERVLWGYTCGSVAPCAGIGLITDIESGKVIESQVGTEAEWSPNRRYIAFAIGDTGAHPL
jgi:Tol biopolymer transport system component